jgi:hypothetical protein
MAYVYGHYKADTDELFYVGKGTGNRAWVKKGRNTHWQRIVAKHGYTVRILEDNLTDEQAYSRETELIEEVGLGTLANISAGGGIPTGPEWLAKVTESNRNRGDEFRKNMSASIQKKFDEDPEYKQRVTEINRKQAQTPEWRKKNLEVAEMNRNNPEFKRKTSEASKRRWADPEYRQKMLQIRRTPEYRNRVSEMHKGRTHSEESRQKMSAAKKGKTPWNKGKSSSNLNVPSIDPALMSAVSAIKLSMLAVPSIYRSRHSWPVRPKS